jgi:ubiquinone/menaquinone biosynthesis C-methylase UbiE
LLVSLTRTVTCDMLLAHYHHLHLDIACSTGHRTVGLAPYFTKVYGIDSNIEKLHRAQRADNILYIVSEVTSSSDQSCLSVCAALDL